MDINGIPFCISQLPVPLIRIDESSRDLYLDHGYNPPVTAEQRQAQATEWYEVFDRVLAVVSKHWRHGVEDGDFFMSSDREPSRLISIEIGNEQMINSSLLKAVHSVVANYAVNFSIDFCSDWFYLKTADGRPYPHFNIFIEKDRVLVFTESDALLERLGR